MKKYNNNTRLNKTKEQADSPCTFAPHPHEFALRVGETANWQRLDACLGQALTGRFSREKLKKAILGGAVSLNGVICQSPKTQVGPGDEVRLALDPALAQAGAASLTPASNSAPVSAFDPALAALLPGGQRLPQAEDGPLEILYRDADLALINKPADLTVHPCPSCPDGTLVNRLLAHFPELTANFARGGGSGASASSPMSGDLAGAGDLSGAYEFADLVSGEGEYEGFPPQSGDRPGIVHRLDKDTTGLLLVALNEGSRLKLSAAFAARQVQKEYLTLVYGVPAEREGVINVPIGRDPVNKTRMTALSQTRPQAHSLTRPSSASRHQPGQAESPGWFASPDLTEDADAFSCVGRSGKGRDALSEYRTLYSDPRGLFSLLAVRIHTGRTHQIRVHLRFLGHPVIGDAVYFDYRAIRPVLEPFLHGRPDLLQDSRSLRAFTRLFAARPLLHAWKLCLEHPAVLEKSGNSIGSEDAPSPNLDAALSLKSSDTRCNAVASGESGNSPHELSFVCPPPKDFYDCLAVLGQRSQPVVLTGNVGCGKSSVLAGLARRGIPVWSADRAVADLYQPGQSGWHMLRSAFGSRFVPDGAAQVDKKALFAAMCEDERLRREVERLIHPLAAGAMREFFAGCAGLPGLSDLSGPPGLQAGGANADADKLGRVAARTVDSAVDNCALAVAEVPLYFESIKLPDSAVNLQGKLTQAPQALLASPPLVLGVHCPRSIRVERLRLKRGWPDAMIEKMESWQWDEDKKMQACDLVLDNSGSLEDLDGRIEAALAGLAARRERELRDLLNQVRTLTCKTE